MRFGRLVVIERVENHPKWKRPQWLCRCDCGAQIVVLSNSLSTGNTRSCGCLKVDLVRALPKKGKHGHSRRGARRPEYNSWTAMKKRCSNPSARRWEHYGGRGITVCDRWARDYVAFFDDMGPKPSPRHSLDRIDPNGNYEPGNCRWATPEQQRANRRK